MPPKISCSYSSATKTELVVNCNCFDIQRLDDHATNAAVLFNVFCCSLSDIGFKWLMHHFFCSAMVWVHAIRFFSQSLRTALLQWRCNLSARLTDVACLSKPVRDVLREPGLLISQSLFMTMLPKIPIYKHERKERT